MDEYRRHGRQHAAGGTDPLLLKDNRSATAAPAVTDDRLKGYGVGSRWIDTTADKEYVCLDATAGAAVWTETTSGGAGGSPHNVLDGSTHPDTLLGAVAAGDVIVGNATPKWARLAANATATAMFLKSVSGAVAAWVQVGHGDLSGVTADQHHTENHKARHVVGGADAFGLTDDLQAKGLATANTGIDSGSVVASSLLNVVSTAKGVTVFPRMTAAQRDAIATPVQGLIVYVTGDNSLYRYDGAAWAAIGGAAATVSMAQVWYLT